jgi:hypothetical protein
MRLFPNNLPEAADPDDRWTAAFLPLGVCRGQEYTGMDRPGNMGVMGIVDKLGDRNCRMQIEKCKLQIAESDHQSAICNLQFSICNLHFAGSAAGRHRRETLDTTSAMRYSATTASAPWRSLRVNDPFDAC